MSKYKYRAGIGLTFSEKKDVQMMEKMARKGYRPVALNILGFYKFEKTQIEEVIYSADYSTIDSCSCEFDDYIEIFKSAGWQHVLCVGTCHWFKAPIGTIPIYTDKRNEAEKHRNIFRRFCKELLGIILLGALFMILRLVISAPFFTIAFSILLYACIGIAVALVVGAVLSWNMVQKLK